MANSRILKLIDTEMGDVENITIIKVKAHQRSRIGHAEGNNRADDLANEGRLKDVKLREDIIKQKKESQEKRRLEKKNSRAIPKKPEPKPKKTSKTLVKKKKPGLVTIDHFFHKL